jgi:hypothetical protein
MLQRWSAWTYTTLVALSTVVAVFAFGHFSPAALAVRVLVVASLFYVTRQPFQNA